MVVPRSMNSTIAVPEHSNHTLSVGKGSLKLLCCREIGVHPLFGLLFCFFGFEADPCLVPCDDLLQKIFIMVAMEKR